MHASSRFLAVGLFAFSAAAVLWVGGSALLRPPRNLTLGDGLAPPKPSVRQPRRLASAEPVSAHALSRAQEQLTQLQRKYRLTRTLLDRRTESLREKDIECAALRDELDKSIAFYFSTLEESDATPSAAARELATQLKAVHTESQRNSREWREQNQQVSALQDTILELEDQIAALQRVAEHEITLLLADRDALAEALRGVVSLLDEDAVRALSALLEDPRAAIRSWAARALAELGEEAGPAVPALVELLDDEDGEVREAAQLALSAIVP